MPPLQATIPLEQKGIPNMPLLLEELLAGVPLLELEELEETKGIQIISPGKNAPKGVKLLQPGVFTPDITTHPGAPVKPLVQAPVNPTGQTTNFPLHAGATALQYIGNIICKKNTSVIRPVKHCFRKFFKSFSFLEIILFMPVNFLNMLDKFHYIKS